METLGQYLKQEREARRLSLEEIAKATRIKGAYLRDLEADTFGSIPGCVFLRGYLRLYATSVGLDPDEVLRRFEAQSLGEGLTGQTGRDGQTAAAGRSWVHWKRPRVTALVTVSLLIAGLGLGYLLADRQSDRPLREPAWRKARLPLPDRQAGDRQGRVGTTGPAYPVEIEARSPTGSMEEFTLTLSAVEDTWLTVRLDGRKSHEVYLQKGERVRWLAQDRAVLTLGNAGGVQIRYNGKPVESLGASGQVVRNIVFLKGQERPMIFPKPKPDAYPFADEG
ncbi:MAG: helix-turn-helix domain-containing protein [Nitrospirae bacterium]|nr:helix-turn-helix domain-containing protein [Nitrospirota bacterium]